MSVVSITSVIECDDCGCEMGIEIDPAFRIPKDWDLIDISIDHVRHGQQIQTINKVPVATAGYSTSVQDDKCLCPKCTSKADELAA